MIVSARNQGQSTAAYVSIRDAISSRTIVPQYAQRTPSSRTVNREMTGSFPVVIQPALGQERTPSTTSGRSTRCFSTTSKSLTMLIVASGAISERTSTSSWLSSRPSTLTMSLRARRSEGTFIPTETSSPLLPSMPRIARTFSACPPRTWSITVPSRILLTRSSCSSLPSWWSCSSLIVITAECCLVAQQQIQQRHPDRHPVVGLLEVGRVLGLVDLGGDLVDAGQRMHDRQVVTRGLERFGIDLVLA